MILLVLVVTVIGGGLLVLGARAASHRWPGTANAVAWGAAYGVFGVMLLVAIGLLALLFGWLQHGLP